jgi:DNA modification methylase
VQTQLQQINQELQKNPYGDLLEYKSTQPGHFLKDSSGAVVNRYQKPLCLYLQLLKMFCLPGTVVFDATCGSGSLELAAMEASAPADLKFISFDKNKYQTEQATIRWHKACTLPTSTHDLTVDVIEEEKPAD